MSYRMKSIALVSLLGLILAGCGKQDFPKASVDNIEGFSLGSAKIPALKDNPSARELYDGVLKTIKSLNSVAASYDTDTRAAEDWSIDDQNNVTILHEPISVPHANYRFTNPGKELLKIGGPNPLVRVVNNDTLLSVDMNAREFKKTTLQKNLANDLVANWLTLNLVTRNPDFRLVPRTLRRLVRRPDEKVADTDVYVLDMDISTDTTRTSVLGREIRRYYLGKKDLLPRKINILNFSTNATGKDAHDTLSVLVFQGFKCNTNIPDDLFPTQPPSGFTKAKEAEKTAPKP